MFKISNWGLPFNVADYVPCDAFLQKDNLKYHTVNTVVEKNYGIHTKNSQVRLLEIKDIGINLLQKLSVPGLQ